MPIHEPNTMVGAVTALLGIDKSYAFGELRKAVMGGLAGAVPLIVADLADSHISLDEATAAAVAFIVGAFAVFRVRNADADAPVPPAE